MSNNKLSLYIQIKKYLEDQIERGFYRPHDQLPSELELAEQFNVSRITSKNAILKLVEAGKVYRIPGKGTFVQDLKQDKLKVSQKQTNSPKQIRAVGLIMSEVVESHSAEILNQVETALNKAGYALILQQSRHTIEEENKAIEMMLQHNVEGLIIFPVDDEVYNENILRLKLDNFPVVLVDRYLKGIETAAVYSDNMDGAYQLTRALLDQNHQRIALFTSSNFNTITIEDRIRGFEQALDEARIPIDRSTWFTDVLEDNPIEKAVDFLRNNPNITGLFAMNAYAGKIAFQAADILKKETSRDFAIVSFDQDRALDIYSVYTAKQNSAVIGLKAVELLQALINDPESVEQIVIPVEICTNSLVNKQIQKKHK